MHAIYIYIYMNFDFVRTFHKVKDIRTEYVAYWYNFSHAGEILLKTVVPFFIV